MRGAKQRPIVVPSISDRAVTIGSIIFLIFASVALSTFALAACYILGIISY